MGQHQDQHEHPETAVPHETQTADHKDGDVTPKPELPKMNWDPRESWRIVKGSLGSVGHTFGNLWNTLGGVYHKAEKKADDFYNNAPVRIANFKRDYILPLGDERVRLIVLSVLSIPLWRISNYRTATSRILKARNLALTFAGLGVILSPQIFNPFLHELRAPSVVQHPKLVTDKPSK